VPQVEAGEDTGGDEAVALDLLTNGWSGLLAGHDLSRLEAALRAWLPRQRWFGAKTRNIQSMSLLNWVELPPPPQATLRSLPIADSTVDRRMPPALLFVEISYADGLSDTYQLPLAFSTSADAEDIIASNPQSILATFMTPAGPAVLHDATTREDFRQGLLTLIDRNAALPLCTARGAGL